MKRKGFSLTEFFDDSLIREKTLPNLRRNKFKKNSCLIWFLNLFFNKFIFA